MKFLDEFAFEQQRLGFAADDVDIQIMNGFDKRLELGVPAEVAGRVEILADAPAQVPRLAHVDDRSKPVLHQVDARFVGQFSQFFAYGRRCDHAWLYITRIRPFATPAQPVLDFPQIGIFHECVAEHVADGHLGIFDAAIMM